MCKCACTNVCPTKDALQAQELEEHTALHLRMVWDGINLLLNMFELG
jgi:hypothetical protein